MLSNFYCRIVFSNRFENTVQHGNLRKSEKNMIKHVFSVRWLNVKKHLRAWLNDDRCRTSDVGRPMLDTFDPPFNVMTRDKRIVLFIACASN